MGPRDLGIYGAVVPLSMGAFWRRRVLVLVASMRIAGWGKAQTKKGWTYVGLREPSRGNNGGAWEALLFTGSVGDEVG